MDDYLNTGALFTSINKRNDRAPDMNGNIKFDKAYLMEMIDKAEGEDTVTIKLDGWVKRDKNNNRMVSMKVNNPEIWDGWVKTGKVKGFSIEGYFVDRMNFSNQELEKIEEQEAALLLSQIVGIIKRDGLPQIFSCLCLHQLPHSHQLGS